MQPSRQFGVTPGQANSRIWLVQPRLESGKDDRIVLF